LARFTIRANSGSGELQLPELFLPISGDQSFS